MFVNSVQSDLLIGIQRGLQPVIGKLLGAAFGALTPSAVNANEDET